MPPFVRWFGWPLRGQARSYRGGVSALDYRTPDATKPALGGFWLVSYLVGRGKLNRIVNLLILISNFLLEICVEYLLEYQRFPQIVGIFSDISVNCLD
jgi:hypothetical protein